MFDRMLYPVSHTFGGALTSVVLRIRVIFVLVLAKLKAACDPAGGRGEEVEVYRLGRGIHLEGQEQESEKQTQHTK